MTELAERLEKLPELLEERVARYRVPGASLAVLCDGQTFETAAGVVNRNTRVETTPDAVFQIGSITKLFTTTLIMQLVEEGRLDLDLARYLGTYERLASRQVVEERDGKLVMTTTDRRPLMGEGEQTTVELSPVTESTFAWLVPGTGFRNYLTFLEFGEDGRAGYLNSGSGTAPRVR